MIEAKPESNTGSVPDSVKELWVGILALFIRGARHLLKLGDE
jgi:hypothetical protein